MTSRVPVSLVVTDLDGTFWHLDHEVHDEVVAAVHKVTSSVYRSSWRRSPSALDARSSRRVGLTPPAVVLNGALGVDLATASGSIGAYTSEQATEVLGAFRSWARSGHVRRPSAYDVFLSETPSTHPITSAGWGHSRGRRSGPVAAEEAVLAFSMIGVSFADARAAASAVADRGETHVDGSFDFPGMASMTVAPEGNRSGTGARLLRGEGSRSDPGAGPRRRAQRHRAARQRRRAARARGGAPSALERADHVIPAAADGGWAEVLSHLP